MNKIPCLLSALSLCLWRAMPECGSISRFWGVFRAFWGFRVGLCWLGGLRGLCGFCTRVELGGLKACSVFASVYPLLCPAFIFVVLLFVLLSSLLVLSFACPLALSLWLFGCGCCFFFPYGLYAKRKDAKGLLLASSLVLLWAYL